MSNNFQNWLISQGYSRKDGSLEWLKDGKIVSGKELSEKLSEFKALINDGTM